MGLAPCGNGTSSPTSSRPRDTADAEAGRLETLSGDSERDLSLAPAVAGRVAGGDGGGEVMRWCGHGRCSSSAAKGAMVVRRTWLR